MSPITTHVLDTSRGKPAAGVKVILARMEETGAIVPWAAGETNADGRVPNLLPEGSKLAAGVYYLTFATGEWFQKEGLPVFYPVVQVIFELKEPADHYHIPLLLSPFGYSTYRGS